MKKDHSHSKITTNLATMTSIKKKHKHTDDAQPKANMISIISYLRNYVAKHCQILFLTSKHLYCPETSSTTEFPQVDFTLHNLNNYSIIYSNINLANNSAIFYKPKSFQALNTLPHKVNISAS